MNLACCTKLEYSYSLNEGILLFIAEQVGIHVKVITEKGPQGSGISKLKLPFVPPRLTTTTDESPEERKINYIRTGFINSQEYIGVTDTYGKVTLWKCSDLGSEPLVLDVPDSAWSLAFSGDSRVFVGTNAHCISVFDINSKELVSTLRTHEHNIPCLESINGDFVASTSIDGTLRISNLKDHEFDVRVDLGQWGWTCRFIGACELESTLNIAKVGQYYRVKAITTCFEDGAMPPPNEHEIREIMADMFYSRNVQYLRQRLELIDYELSAEEGLGMHEVDDFDDHEADGLDADDHEGWPMVEEELESMGQGSEESLESDTGILNRARRLQNLHENNSPERPRSIPTSFDASDLDEYIETHSLPPPTLSQVYGNEMEFEVATSSRSFNDRGLLAVTCNSSFRLIGLDGQEHLRIPDLRAFCVKTLQLSHISPVWLQFDRFNMSQWIPELSTLIVGNQSGFVVVLSVLTDEARKIKVRAAAIPQSTGNWPLAGFVVYPVDLDRRLVWNLYMIYQDGKYLIVRLEKKLSHLDLTNISKTYL